MIFCIALQLICILLLLVRYVRLQKRYVASVQLRELLDSRVQELLLLSKALHKDLESARKYPTVDYRMSGDEYQIRAVKTAVYPDKHKIVYPAMGLADEAGEVVGKVKKMLRGDYKLTVQKKFEIAKELGDVQWYIACLSRDLGFTLGYIQQLNLEKLEDRAERGTIKGDGDNR